MRRLKAILFDLDGTLLDTAPDMVGTLNEMLANDAHSPADFAAARAQVSNGALGLLRVGYPDADEATILALREQFLARYADRVAHETRPFPGMLNVLERLEAHDCAWGIVTNKPGDLTAALLDELALTDRCATIVSGDTLPLRKPNPEPLLHAAREAGVEPGASVYVGDAPRDIQAGQAAGMATIAAAYGYVEAEQPVLSWGADHVIESPLDLEPLLVTLGVLPA